MLVAEGFSNKQIAWITNLTPATVKKYLFDITHLLKLSNRASLASWETKRQEEEIDEEQRRKERS